jgi:serine/threonine-protein kinase
MKGCPACGRLYPADAGFCPVDGQQLISATQAPVAPSDQDARIGHVLCERYQVRRVVADGGMGRVYEALDMSKRRNVALKVLHPEVAQDEVSVERFKREFEVSTQLPHAYIVDVLDFQPTHDGSYALVMEFLYGEELRNTLKRQKVLPPGRLVRMLSQLAIGLDEAHARKFVHRDLKPDNVFLCQTREGDIVKILDFGSVKDNAHDAKKLTVLGTTIGSPYYMAPEQAQGLDTLDHRADVWALGAIIYESVTGEVPFKGTNGPAILLEILTKEPPPASQAGRGQKFAVPPALDGVLAQAFKKSAGLRTPSVGALADRVGQAYGLEGNHRNWAVAPQHELEAQIQARMPELLQRPARAGPTDTAADAFFGQGAGVGDVSEPVANAPRDDGSLAYAPTAAAHPAERWAPAPRQAEEPLEIPTQGVGWLLAAVVGGVALVIGVLIVLVVMR